MNYDLIIVGAGPAGYSAAFEAAKLGMKTAVVERGLPGGTCLNRGCVPTKAYLHSAEEYRRIKEGKAAGVQAGGAFDYEQARQRKEDVLAAQRKGLLSAFRLNKIEWIEGKAEILDGCHVAVDGRELEAENVLCAVGSFPARIPIKGMDLDGVWTSDEILEQFRKIDTLAIIGGGVIGMEMAGMYGDLGTKVIVIEALDHILGNMDQDAARNMERIEKKKGTEFHLGCRVQEIREEDDRLRVSFMEKEEEKSVLADKVLVCTGRRGNTDGLFPKEKPEMQRGRIVCGPGGQTSLPHLYAAGDIVYGGVQLAHAAMAMGVNAVRSMKGLAPAKDLGVVPSCVYGDPEIASVGIMEQTEKTVIGKAAMHGNARSLIAQDERGFIKVCVRRSDHVLLGAVIAAARATDMIEALELAVCRGMALEDVGAMIFPHPTYAEAIADALEDASGKIGSSMRRGK